MVISFSTALRQLQGATQAKTQLEWELLLKWEGLSRTHKDQQTRVTKEQEDQQARRTKEQEDYQARMTKQVDTTFREVLSQMSEANLVRLLPWFLSATANSTAGPIHYHSISSCSPHVGHSSCWHSSQVPTLHVHHQCQEQEAGLLSWWCIWWLTWQESSCWEHGSWCQQQVHLSICSTWTQQWSPARN